MFDYFPAAQSEEREGIRRPLSVPIPFLRGPIGSGDLARTLTDALHIPHCGGCGRRQDRMNRAVEFRPMRSLWED